MLTSHLSTWLLPRRSCMGAHMCVWVHTCVYGCTHVCMGAHMCVWVHTCVYECTHVCMGAHMCVWVHTCVNGCTHVCMGAHMCVWVHTSAHHLLHVCACMCRLYGCVDLSLSHPPSLSLSCPHFCVCLSLPAGNIFDDLPRQSCVLVVWVRVLVSVLYGLYSRLRIGRHRILRWL